MIGWLFQHAKHEQHNSQVSKIIRKHFEQIDELTDSRGCTLLHILAQHDNLSLLSFVLNLYDQKPLPFTKAEWLNLNDNEGNTPLHYSAFKGSLSAVQLLQKSGANSWAINKKGLNCVHFAAQAGSPLIMYYFMEKGISIDCVDHNRNTPLHWAVYAGSDCAVTALLCWGAAADLQEQNGDTALHIAVMFGRIKTIAKLVSYGCDVTIKNKNDRTAYELALEQGYENIQSYLLPQERTCIKRLLCRESAGGIHKRSMFGLSISVLLLSLILNSVSFYIYSNTAIFALFITTIVLGAACFILLIILHNTDAGSISSRRYDKDAYMKLLIQNDPKVICFQCQIKKPVRSKHCYECGRCIRVFDHHCSWLGNCIGTNNTLLFIILLLICTIYIILTLLSHIIGIATSSEYDLGTLKAGLFVCSSLSVILSILGLVPISYLLVRHCRLSLRGVTFYEHYKLSIAKRSNGDIMLKEKRKIVTGREEIMRKEKAPSEDSSSTHRRPLINRVNIDHDQQRRSSDLLQSKGCFQQAKWLLCKNKYVKQYGWNEQP